MLVESEIWNLGLWNLEYSSNKTESYERLESRIQVPLTKTEIQYLESRIQGGESRKPLLFWIPLTREDKLMHSFGNEN